MTRGKARLADGAEVELTGTTVAIPWRMIRPMPGQPRSHFDQEELWALARSIKAIGQRREVEVVPTGDQKTPFQLVDGQRRWHAVQLVNIEILKAVIRDVGTDDEMYVASVAANFGRADHTPLEIAEIIRRLTDQGKTIDQIAEICAKSRGWVEIYKRLLNLHEDVRKRLEPDCPADRKLAVGVANRLGRLSPDEQLKAMAEIDKRGLSSQSSILLIDRASRKPGALHTNSRKRRVSPIDKYRSWAGAITASRDKLAGVFSDADLFPQVMPIRRPGEIASVLADLLEAQKTVAALIEKIAVYQKKA